MSYYSIPVPSKRVSGAANRSQSSPGSPVRLYAEDVAVEACLRRINLLLRRALPFVHVEVAGHGPDGRVDLVARQDSVPIGGTFLLLNECKEAFEVDPEHCRPVDEIARGWIVVLSYRAREVAKFRKRER